MATQVGKPVLWQTFTGVLPVIVVSFTTDRGGSRFSSFIPPEPLDQIKKSSLYGANRRDSSHGALGLTGRHLSNATQNPRTVSPRGESQGYRFARLPTRGTNSPNSRVSFG